MSGGYQVYRAALPEVCAADPARMVFTADAGGRCEVFAWDAAAGRARQVTRRARGTLHGAVDRDAHVWWFDEDAHGAGCWRFQPFTGGPDRPGLTDVPPGLPRGLAVSDHGTSRRRGRGRPRHHRPRGPARRPGPHGGPPPGPCHPHRHHPRGRLLALAGADAVTVLTCDGVVRAVLPGGDTGRLWSLGFAPGPDREELLLIREREDGYVLASWRPGSGPTTHDWCAFDTEITARWDADGRSVLVRQDRHGRSTLHRADLTARTLSPVPTPRAPCWTPPPGPGGDLHYLWTAAGRLPPPVLHPGAPPCPNCPPCPSRSPVPTGTCGRPARTAPCTACSACPTRRAVRSRRCSWCTAGPPTTTGTPTTASSTPSSRPVSRSSASTPRLHRLRAALAAGLPGRCRTHPGRGPGVRPRRPRRPPADPRGRRGAVGHLLGRLPSCCSPSAPAPACGRRGSR